MNTFTREIEQVNTKPKAKDAEDDTPFFVSTIHYNTNYTQVLLLAPFILRQKGFGLGARRDPLLLDGIPRLVGCLVRIHHHLR
jgi:hypothetical protein